MKKAPRSLVPLSARTRGSWGRPPCAGSDSENKEMSSGASAMIAQLVLIEPMTNSRNRISR